MWEISLVMVDANYEPPMLDIRAESSAALACDQLCFQVIDNLKKLEEIKPLWLELEKNSTDPHCSFQSYAWCESWARFYCTQDAQFKMQIYCVFQGEKLLAILPSMIAHHTGAKTLTLLGEPHSQIANVIFRKDENTTPAIQLCLDNMRKKNDIDVITLGPFPKESPLAMALEVEKISEDPAHGMSLVTWADHASKQSYIASLKKNRRRDFVKKFRRLEKRGPVEFTRHEPGSKNFEELISTAIKWKREWLSSNKLFSAGLAYPNVAAFLSNVNERSGGFQIELEALRLNTVPIAICINLIGKKTRSCYLSAYDPSFKNVSPGTLIHQLSIQNSIETGDDSYNFLGFPTAFKGMWANHSIPLLRYQNPLTFRGKVWVQFWVNGIRPLLKKALLKTRSSTFLSLVLNMAQRPAKRFFLKIR